MEGPVPVRAVHLLSQEGRQHVHERCRSSIKLFYNNEFCFPGENAFKTISGRGGPRTYLSEEDCLWGGCLNRRKPRTGCYQNEPKVEIHQNERPGWRGQKSYWDCHQDSSRAKGSVSELSRVIGGSSKPGNADCFSLFLFIGTLAGPMCYVQADLYIYMVIQSL